MNNRRRRQRGGSALEMALLLPWYFFLFVGTFDWGFYAHALISTEAAARTAVLYTSQSVATASDQADACRHRPGRRLSPRFAMYRGRLSARRLRWKSARARKSPSRMCPQTGKNTRAAEVPFPVRFPHVVFCAGYSLSLPTQ